MAGGGGGKTKGGRKKARIEIVPLIDIMFFLCATFILVNLTMTKNQGVTVAVPAASSASKQDDKKNTTVTLSVTEKGEVFYNKDKITIAQLPYRLQTLKATDKEANIIINGDGNADFKVVVSVLDEVKKIGISKVGISTEKK
ncbi:MAG: biopolymer transporter ExbD [Candidatus Methylacidiphilales bacterium]|nr:biopolymer transporter ExbD [Candidatus Methylacidiphilales bacterium]